MTVRHTPAERYKFWGELCNVARLGSLTGWRREWFDEWARCEGSEAQHNPLATTEPGREDPANPWFNTFGHLGQYHVRNYVSLEAGAQQTAKTLTNGYYPNVVRALATERVEPWYRRAIAEQLRTWGSRIFADEIEDDGWEPRQGEGQGAEGEGGLDVPELVFTRYPLQEMPGNISGRFAQDYGGYLHRGVDAGGFALAVRAPAAGKSVAFSNDGSYGIAVCLEHPGTGWFSLYAHLSERLVNIGESVRAGELIGYTGFTGTVRPAGVAGAHLHWQTCRNTQFPTDIRYSADPLTFVRLEEDMTEDQVKAIVNDVLANTVINDHRGAPIATRDQILDALVRRQRAMGRATSLEDVIAANDKDVVPS